MTHLVALSGGWSLWTWACLRATGFPATRILDLASPVLSAKADELFIIQDRAAEARDALIAACKAAAADDTATDDERRSIQRALKRIWQHRVPDPLAVPAVELVRQRLDEAVSAREQARREFAEHHTHAQRATSEALRHIGRDDPFRQALLWQNRTAVVTGVDWLLRQPTTATDSQTRKNERLIASYLQRYCVKNDTIGFFGPVGWARIGDFEQAIHQRPGNSLLASRTVYYEYWAIDALATKLASSPAIRPFLAPRRLPRFRLDGITLHYPVGQRAELPAEFAAVAARCDGISTARQIAQTLAADASLGLADEADVFDILDELAAKRIIQWTLEIPTAVIHPERPLAAQLARIDDAEIRGRAEAILAELDQRRSRVAAARDAAQLDAALVAFDSAFTAATDANTRRAHGQTYAGRTPLYEDCRRDLELALGRPFVDRLAGPLALLLHSARWFCHEIAARYRRALDAIYQRIATPNERIELARLWQDVPALFPGGGTPGSIVADVRAELHRRWTAILAIGPDERAVQRTNAVLADAVRTSFAAPGPGWPAARHHSPDVMIAAAGPDAIARGDYTIVIGELHVGFNTVVEPLFVKQHPTPGDLIAARDADIAAPAIAPVWSKAVTRGDYYSLSPRDLDLEHADTRSARPASHVIATADLLVGDRDGALEVTTRDGAHRFDIIAFLEHHLIAESYAHFSPIASGPRTPRVTIDGVVIARETWRFAAPDLAWPSLDEPAERFLAARRWARSLGMPRWMFAKTPEEVKPVYVDFDSAIYVELLAKQLRGATTVSLSEMLPSVDDTWVIDANGERYTAELRLAAVDSEAWTAIASPCERDQQR